VELGRRARSFGGNGGRDPDRDRRESLSMGGGGVVCPLADSIAAPSGNCGRSVTII
jgi:hypothetical protein